MFGDSVREQACLHLDLAKKYLDRGWYDRAVQETTKCLKLKGFSEAYIYRGLAYYQGGEVYSAMEDLKRGLDVLDSFFAKGIGSDEILQVYVSGCIAMGFCYVQFQSVEEAKKYEEKASMFLVTNKKLKGKELKKLKEDIAKLERMPYNQRQIQDSHLMNQEVEIGESSAKMKRINSHNQKSILCKEIQAKNEQQIAVNKNNEEDFQDLKCPITAQVFKEPVVAHDGNTYEKNAIKQWFQRSLTSPLTNEPLQSEILIPNLTLKKIQKELDLLKKKERNQKERLDDLQYFEERKLNQNFEHKVECSKCHIFPIIGIRYKCTIRKNYNLCSECEVDSPFYFPLIKFKFPEDYQQGRKKHA